MKNSIKWRKKLLGQLAATGNFIKGSINSVCGACGRAACICRKKSGTKAYRLTYKNARQETQIVYVPRKRLPEMKRLIANYTRIRTLIEKIIQTNIAIFKMG